MRFPQRPPELAALLLQQDWAQLVPHITPTLADGRYLHWDELRRRPPPLKMTHESWWASQKLARIGSRVPVRGSLDERGTEFWFCRIDAIDRAIHQLDRRDAVREMLESIGDESLRTQYRINQLIEEAISSSLIEGAKLTTRAHAQEMLREGRQPTSKGERMVANNYAAMKRLLELVGREIGLDDLLEIHAILGADALDEPRSEGRLRTPEDQVRIEDSSTGDTWFVPPPAQELPERLGALLAFANDNEQAKGPFLHPLLRAITLHFWLAYLHPFVDGNGRMARALFYWQMLRSGYDFAEYLSISGPIDRSRRAYYRAFVLTETDELDLTYFFLHQLSVLGRATEDLVEHLRQRAQALQQLPRSAKVQSLNHRQKAVLAAFLRHPHSDVTVTSHERSHGVSYLTARKDLQSMEQVGLVRRARIGKTDHYSMSLEFVRQLKKKKRH